MYESIDRCVEMARPVLFTLGSSGLRGNNAATMAGFSILHEVAKQTAEKGARLLISVQSAETLPIIQSIVRESHIAAGSPEAYNEDDIMFVGGSQFSSTAVILELMDRYRPGSFIFPGGTGWSRVVYGAHAAKIGAISIGGIINTWQIHYAIASYDYLLLCEDFLAAGAMITKEPKLVSNIWAGDIYRFILIGLILVSALFTWVGVDINWLWST
jgi:hypothetical protein